MILVEYVEKFTVSGENLNAGKGILFPQCRISLQVINNLK